MFGKFIMLRKSEEERETKTDSARQVILNQIEKTEREIEEMTQDLEKDPAIQTLKMRIDHVNAKQKILDDIDPVQPDPTIPYERERLFTLARDVSEDQVE